MDIITKKWFFDLIKGRIIEQIKNIFLKSEIIYSIASAIFRISLRNNFIFKQYFKFRKSVNFESIDEFWKIRIGFINRRNYFPYLNLGSHLINKPPFCVSLNKFPFKNESCKEIYVRHLFKYASLKKIKPILKSWHKILIPGGYLKIEFPLKGNERRFEILKNYLKEKKFFIEKVKKTDLKFNGRIKILAIKQKLIKNNANYFSSKKIRDIFSILKQNKSLFLGKKKICILGKHSNLIKKQLKEIYSDFSEIVSFNSVELFFNISENDFDLCVIANCIEFCQNWRLNEIFNQIRRILKPNSPIFLLVPEKKNYYLKESVQLLDKGIFMRKLDENNFVIKWINLSSSLKMIQVLAENQYENPSIKNDTKVCLLGYYTLRYSFLNSPTWDGQIRALEKLGYESLILDILDNSYQYIFKRIIDFEPDILWVAGRKTLDFLKKYSDFFIESKIKVIYWMMDVRIPKRINFKGIIDYMFLSNKGQIPLYKKRYNIDKIFYMPQFITPQILHRNKNIREEYEIGFVGGLDFSKYHKKRTQIIIYLMKFFNVKIVNNLYNNLPEFLSQCKIIFGGAPDLDHLELYTSNRLYVALSCGCCYITNYFNGIEKLAENEKKIIWYRNKNELVDLIKKYLSNKEQRFKIKKNAEELARLKHNYLIRIQNIIDIINNKTEEFYGFIE